MTVERHVFDFFEYPFVGIWISLNKGKNTVTKGCVRGELSVHPKVTYVFVMRRVVKREVLEIIIPRGMNNWIILGESRHEFLQFFMMHKTEMPLVNVAKNVQREDIKPRTNF